MMSRYLKKIIVDGRELEDNLRVFELLVDFGSTCHGFGVFSD